MKKHVRGSGAPSAELQAIVKRNQALRTDIQSKEILNFVDLLSEGEIYGLSTGDLKSVYFDKTAVENPDGSMNFDIGAFDTRSGTQNQTYLKGFSEVENGIPVSTEATFATPVVRSITSSQVNAVIVTISLPSLLDTDTSTGQINGNSVDIEIDVQTNGGGYVTKITDTIIGKSTGQYEKSYRINLSGSAPWDIKVKRISPDSVSALSQNKTYFSSYTEITDAKLTYPNSALVYMQLDSSQFSSIPNRAYLIKGLKIKIPSNATVNSDGSLSYSGIWDGTFGAAVWCSNPVWILFDLLTTKRYGCGNYISESQLDKWTLYSIGVFCDEKVSNGDGGLEARFSCNLYLQSQASAYQVISDLCSCFRAMAYWSSGTINITQDSPKDAVYLFTAANVLNGTFTYAGASAKARHSVALVSWNDPSSFFQTMVEYVENTDAIAQFGIVKTQVTAFGCTSRSQANRVGKWLLLSEQNESETVTFSTGIEAAVLRPGQIIQIADPNRAGIRMGGRIVSATSSTLTVDEAPPGTLNGYTLSVLLPDGSVQTNILSSSAGNILTLVGTFSVIPTANSVWLLDSGVVSPQTFRVIGIVENNSGQFDVSALKYDPNKYEEIENNLKLGPRTISLLSQAPPTPGNLTVTENLFTSPQGVKARFILGWDKSLQTPQYLVKYVRDNENPASIYVSANQLEVDDFTPGAYSFQVFAVAASGAMSQPALASKELLGKTAPPGDVENFSIFPNANAAFFTWTKSVDLDVVVGGFVRIRHTPRTTGQTWASSIDVIDFVPGSDTFATGPLLTGTYMAKFVDSSGNESTNETLAVTTIPVPVGLNIVTTLTETDVFGGAMSNTGFIPGLGLILLSEELWDSLGLIDDLTSIDFGSDVLGSGTYDFLSYEDLGSIFTCNLTAHIKTLAFDTANTWDDMVDNIDTWADIDGENLASVNAKLYVSTTNDDPAGSPTWSDFKPFLTGSYQARAFKFRILLTSSILTENIAIEELSVAIAIPDRTEQFNTLTSGLIDPHHVTFAHEFNAVPSIGIITHNMATGDFYTVTNKTVAGFDIVFKNSSGTVVSRNFDCVVTGYGLKG